MAAASVIVPTLNGADRIGALLDSLADGSPSVQVIVVDNGSTDGTADLLARRREVEVIRCERNLGYGRAVNLAAVRAEGDALVLVNDDCVLDPGFAERLVAPLGGEVAMAAGILRDRDAPELIDTAGMQLDETLLVFDYLHGEPLTALAGAPDPIGPSAAAAAFDRAAFVQTGGFDEALFAYWEDVDLVLRLRLEGAACRLAGGARGTHVHSATLGAGSREKNALMGFGRGYVLRKWSVLHGARAARALALDTAICLGQAAIDRNAAGVAARVRGYRAAPAALPYPASALAGPPAPGPRRELGRRLRRRRRLRARRRGSAPVTLESQLGADSTASSGGGAAASGAGRRAAPPATPGWASLTTPLPDPLRVGAGTALLVGGRLAPSLLPGPLVLSVDGEPLPGPIHAARTSTHAAIWWGIADIRPTPAPAELALRLEVDEPEAAASAPASPLATLRVDPGSRGGAAWPGMTTAVAAARAHGGPLVAIAMATRNPPPELLRRQLESIRSQTHGAWLCIVADDASGPEDLDAIRSLARHEPRIVVRSYERRAGFYGNYERALHAVPAEAEFVALADQDDRWDPDKLEVLVSVIGDRSLAYGDMRLVDEVGRQIAPTYWTRRRNNYTDLASLLVGNTVTGAASLFRAGVLDTALPFPPEFSDSYQDHWIALNAMLAGGLAYVDRPLQDYIQHRVAAQGHAEANAGADYLRPSSWPRLARQGVVALTGSQAHGDWARRYFGMHSRTVVWARVLLLRHHRSLTVGERRTLERIARAETSPGSLAWLAGRSLRPLWGRNEAFGRELILLSSAVWCRSLERRSEAHGS